jgi:hypothetical protein
LTARSINDLCSEVARKDTWRRRLLTDSFIFSSHDLLRFYTRLDVQVCRSDVRSRWPWILRINSLSNWETGRELRNGRRQSGRESCLRRSRFTHIAYALAQIAQNMGWIL